MRTERLKMSVNGFAMIGANILKKNGEIPSAPADFLGSNSSSSKTSLFAIGWKVKLWESRREQVAGFEQVASQGVWVQLISVQRAVLDKSN